MLKLTGIATVSTVLAGCGDGGGPGEEEPAGGGEEPAGGGEEEPAGGGEEEEPAGGGEEEEPAGGEEEEANETEEDGEESGDGGGDAIDPETEIELIGETQGWQGEAPDDIADEENPTLTLQEGESYDITWENGDGAEHNIEIRDDNDEVVDDYQTDTMGEEGETQTLEIDEVTDEMATYVCEPHETTMVGDIELA
ncbi:cupredoxin domain-containing protein [Halopiger goleimassiliensis]|uniref:cupredoxin domain-containing protein n=1 Tax=Halopiger goleimassiliensis TaxID=1293048 RepID=UPI000A765E76|nr:plastocyanin/azurin family copper-binding protein [Halopiger goleimassiliensis]